MNESALTVVFVCEHGAAKSVVAAAYFNWLAEERHMTLRAFARGTNPDDEVASVAITGLQLDGLTADQPPPKKITRAEVAEAVYLVSFCELPEAYVESAAAFARWDDVPAVGESYAKARDAMVVRIGLLLDKLERNGRHASPSWSPKMK